MPAEPAGTIDNAYSAAHMRGLTIIIPLYRSLEHLGGISTSLHSITGELKALNAHILLINDSPDDEAHARALADLTHSLSRHISAEKLTNTQNLGFIKSTNLGLEIAHRRGDHAVLLNSDTILFPGTLTEMLAGFDHDTMVGFVCPRSNDATLCSLPTSDICTPLPEDGSPEHHARIHADISKFLPRFSYVPTGVGFCLLVRWNILAEFGMLDEIYGHGYDEENDLIMRANRCGYRALLANRAFTYHKGSGSFTAEKKSIQQHRNSKILSSRYPEYTSSIQHHMTSPQFYGETILSERSLRTKQGATIEVALDARVLSDITHGTSQVICRMAAELTHCARGSNIRISLVCSAAAAVYHKLDQVDGLTIVAQDDAYGFDFWLKFGQPFSAYEFWDASRRAVKTIFTMLDTISWDCLYLRTADQDALWRMTADLADAILFISPFSKDQFMKRFTLNPGVRTMVTELSLDVADYVDEITQENELSQTPAPQFQDVLIFGNHFLHKFVRPTAEHLAQKLTNHRIFMFGDTGPTRFPNIISSASGKLGAAEMNALYRNAACVVYPSTYEGFGLPVVEALARNQTVYVRDTPLNRWIRNRWNGRRKIVPMRLVK